VIFRVTRVLQGLLLLLLLLAMVSCATKTKDETEAEAGDGPSTTGLRAEDVKDAIPRAEAKARYGNHSPYEVFGKEYYVMDSNKDYRQRGTASWYGSKFHGRRTSSGEPYDMHLATAAHKTLPLPTYAEVTNLDNGRKVVVKINDRGPFKDDRLIDMSYGAALRLGMTNTGTARVDVRVINTGTMAAESTDTHGDIWLQAGAFSQKSGAKDLARKLEKADLQPVSVEKGGKLSRVWLGPYNNSVEIEAVIQKVIELGFERPHKVRR
jgi:rare lipoprotein A